MIYDINGRYPRGYVHRHKCHTRTAPFKQVGQSEVIMMVEMLDKLIVGTAVQPTTTLMHPTTGVEEVYLQKKIYTKPPHIVADNFFTSDLLMDYMGERGYGMTGTCAKNRIPEELKPYTHHTKVDATHQRCRVMRFENPIVAIKQSEATVKGKAFTKTFISFQSTGATNIIGVNNLPSCGLYITQRSRGKKNSSSKRVWGIEQNEARESYLTHYYGCDNADHMVKNAGNQFISWKYWHAAYRHVISLGIIAAYDMYIECCEGNLDASWLVVEKSRMTFRSFRMLMANQMMSYDPSKRMYPGDETFRAFTQKHKNRRISSDNTEVQKKDGKKAKHDNDVTEITYDSYQKAVHAGRLCLTVDNIKLHFESVRRLTNSEACEVCGEKTIWKCSRCYKSLCTVEKRKWNGAKCLFLYHSPEFYGLARSDCKSVETWNAPTPQVMEKNGRMIKRWMNNEN